MRYVSIDPIYQKIKGVIAVAIILWLLVGCVSPPVMRTPAPSGTEGTVPSFVHGPAVDALPAMILAERTAAATGDLELLARLWSEESRVVDERNSASPADDYMWTPRAAVLDRYVVAVFTNPPPLLQGLENYTIEQGEADLRDGVQEGQRMRVRTENDQWTFVFHRDRWWIEELRYGLHALE